MLNPEVVLQLMIDPRQHIFALRQLHLHHLHVARQRMALRGQAPHMQVMHIHHALNPLHRRSNLRQVHPSRQAVARV